MPLSNAQAVIAEFFDEAILPAAQGGLRGFTAGFIGGLAVRQAPSMVERFIPLGKSLGLVDENGTLDIDLAHEEASKAIAKTGVVEVGSYRVDQADIDKLRDIMRRHGA